MVEKGNIASPVDFSGGTNGKELTMQETWHVSSVPGWEDPLEEGVATHSSILAWESPWAQEPGLLQSLKLQNSRTQLKTLSM